MRRYTSNVSGELIWLVEYMNVGFRAGQNLFCTNDTPSKPDRIAIIKIDGTLQPDNPRIDMQEIAFRITCRDSAGNQQKCEENLNKMRVAFREIGRLDALQSSFVSITHVFGPADIGPDANMRPIFMANFSATRTGSVKEFSYYGNPSDSGKIYNGGDKLSSSTSGT